MATTKKYFRTPVDEPVNITTPSGEEEEEILAMKLDEKGNEIFYVKGKTNVYEKIQAYLEETKIENILARVIDTGDSSFLDIRKGEYMDISEYPKDIFEAHRKIKEAEEIFNNLPVEVRAKYDHNFSKYLADFGTENWIKNMGMEEKKEPEPEPVKETEKGEENK